MEEYKKAFNIWEAIKRYDNIIIYGHVNPDGDCVSSARAMKALIKEYFPNKVVYVAGTIPFNLTNLVNQSDDLFLVKRKEYLGICVDLNDVKRIEDSSYKDAKELAFIDHHITNDVLKNYPLYYKIVDSASCTFVIYSFIKDLNLKINDEIAYYLYIGLITDTNRFLNNSNIETFKMAEELVSFNIDTKKIYREIDKVNEAMIKFRVFVYTNYKFSKKACYLIVPKEEYLKLGLKQNDISHEIKLLANLNGYHYWCFFIENDDGKTIRCEYRSDGSKNVQKVACRFNGGGHYSESGGTLYSMSDIQKVLDYIDCDDDNS